MHNPLRKVAIEFAGGQEITVCKIVVDALKTAGTQIANPAALNRSRFACEGQETIVGGVAGKIDEDVDAVGLNLCRKSRLERS